MNELVSQLDNSELYPLHSSELTDKLGDLTVDCVDNTKCLEEFLPDDAEETFEALEDVLAHVHAEDDFILRLHDVPTYISSIVEFPITQNELLGLFGSIELDSPTDSETVREVIERCSEGGAYVFQNEDDFSNTLFCNVSDEYIGRKFYDDRGGSETDTQSF